MILIMPKRSTNLSVHKSIRITPDDWAWLSAQPGSVSDTVRSLISRERARDDLYHIGRALPNLYGSDTQITWAVSIRWELITDAYEELLRTRPPDWTDVWTLIRAIVADRKQAATWIAKKSMPLTVLARKILADHRAHQTAPWRTNED